MILPRVVTSTEFAAYLLSIGFPLKGCRPDSGRSVAFLFEDSPRVEAALLQFANGEATVEPRGFLRALSDLRDLARSQTTSEESKRGRG